MEKPLAQITFDFVATEETENTPVVDSPVIVEKKTANKMNEPVVTKKDVKPEPVQASGKRGRRSLKRDRY
jgi:hypothetical protein